VYLYLYQLFIFLSEYLCIFELTVLCISVPELLLLLFIFVLDCLFVFVDRNIHVLLYLYASVSVYLGLYMFQGLLQAASCLGLVAGPPIGGLLFAVRHFIYNDETLYHYRVMCELNFKLHNVCLIYWRLYNNNW